jgi:hypothetical protein
MPTLISGPGTGIHSRNIVALRHELAEAERELRDRAECEAVRLAEAERAAGREAREDCLQLERIRRDANTRLEAIRRGEQERFPAEYALAEMVLREVEAWELRESAAYTIISFACLRKRLRFLHGGAEREAVMHEALTCGGVYTERGYFQEILK